MSLMRRLVMLFRAKANKALDRAEDPREILDYSYERQLELRYDVTLDPARPRVLRTGTLAERYETFPVIVHAARS
jgi:hypothetical protein